MRPGGLIRAGGSWGLLAALIACAGSASAEPLQADAINLQPAATSIAHEIRSFHDFVLPIIVAISVLVLVLLIWVVLRYNRKANPTPKKFTHNMTVEVIWTIVPVLILVAIAWRSFPLLYHEERIPQAELTLKVTGNSWFWSYEYPELGVNIVSNLLPEDEARASGQPWLLATNNALYVPVNTNVRVLVTSNDVIHAFAVPQFGVKEDAIQGRVNETWFNVERPGVYYGQCSELCGVSHAYMPIEIRAVSRAEFDQWVTSQGGAVAGAAPETTPETTTPAPEGARAEAPAR